jgi:hypothetical protein
MEQPQPRGDDEAIYQHRHAAVLRLKQQQQRQRQHDDVHQEKAGEDRRCLGRCASGIPHGDDDDDDDGAVIDRLCFFG